MELAEIYQPIDKELTAVEGVLAGAFSRSDYPLIRQMGDFVMGSPGKRTRPAMTILAAMATCDPSRKSERLSGIVRIAAAFEFIHMASLIHDDIIDRATMRHNRQSVNDRWGDGVSVIFGDFIYSKAFELIADCGNNTINTSICQAVSSMCQGEIDQVCQRDNAQLTEEKYLDIVQSKTASLFAGCCEAGAIIGTDDKNKHSALKEYGLNLGIAFQIIDDCRDITSGQTVLGKLPGQDLMMGEMTLPLMNIIDSVADDQKQNVRDLITRSVSQGDFTEVRQLFLTTSAADKSKALITKYISKARESLEILGDSEYKISLQGLVEFFIDKTF